MDVAYLKRKSFVSIIQIWMIYVLRQKKLLNLEMEETLAKFKGTEAAIAYQSGFNCNMAAISAVMNKNDAILSDELNHASIIDGCRLSKAKIIRVNHSDMDDLRAKAKEAVES